MLFAVVFQHPACAIGRLVAFVADQGDQSIDEIGLSGVAGMAFRQEGNGPAIISLKVVRQSIGDLSHSARRCRRQHLPDRRSRNTGCHRAS